MEAYHSSFEKELERLSNCIQNRRDNNFKVYFLGNGGSVSTASHAVVDFVKTAKGVSNKSVKTFNISEMSSLCTAYSNDDSFESHLARVIRDLCEPSDLVIFLSVSGQSKNLLEAAKTCQNLGIETFALVGAKGQELLNLCTDGIRIQTEDYQIVEDIHLIIVHWLARRLGMTR